MASTFAGALPGDQHETVILQLYLGDALHLFSSPAATMDVYDQVSQQSVSYNQGSWNAPNFQFPRVVDGTAVNAVAAGQTIDTQRDYLQLTLWNNNLGKFDYYRYDFALTSLADGTGHFSDHYPGPPP